MKITPVKDISLKDKIKLSLYDFIRSIDTGANDKLPREETLAKELKVSRNTMRSVLTELEKEGLIIRRHGRGTFINSEALQLKVAFTPSQEFLQMIEKSGYNASLELIKVEVTTVDKKITDHLKLPEGEPLVCVEKVFYANDNPAIYCIDRFPRKLIEGEIIPEELNDIVYLYLKRKVNITIVRDKTEIYTITTQEKKELADYFNVRNPKSFLACETVDFDEDNTPTLFLNVYFNTDFIRFNQVRPKQIIY